MLHNKAITTKYSAPYEVYFVAQLKKFVYRAPATGPRSRGIMHWQPAINNKLAPKPTPNPTLTLT